MMNELDFPHHRVLLCIDIENDLTFIGVKKLLSAS